MDSLEYKLKVPVTILKEGLSYVAWSPALDLSSVGDSAGEAQRRFGEAAEIFFEEIRDKGTLEEVLLGLGWQREKNNFVPPVFVAQRTQEFSFPALSS